MTISQQDKQALRELARRCGELAASPRNQRLYQDWLDHASAGVPSRPMIRIEIDTFEQDVLPPLMTCQGEAARRIEKRLLRPLANFTLFEDDTLLPPYYAVSGHFSFLPFGLPVKRRETAGVGYRFIPYLRVLKEDDHQLGPSVFSVDEQGARREQQVAEDVFGDLLPVRRVGHCLGASPMQNIVQIMGMEDLYIAMAEEEERFHRMMRLLTDGYLAFFRMLAAGGHLRSAARMQHLAQGTYCFSHELPDDQPGAPLNQLWLYMDAQEAAGISPRMFAELVFPYYRELMEAFGLVSYGCCEAPHTIWDSCLGQVPNLRKLSISPWCDERFMGERLSGTGVTYLRKPPATLLGLGTTLDEEAVRASARATMAATARRCKVEFIQRDVYQINGPPEKVRRYVQLFREAF